MDEAAKRRLAGAAVLVALVVIFVPMLVEDPEPGGLGEPIVIPPPPDFDSQFDADVIAPAEDLVLPLPSPEPPGGPAGELIPEPATGEVSPADGADAPAAAATSPETAPATDLAQDLAQDLASDPSPGAASEPGPAPLPAGTRAWVVQVASLGTRDAAVKMRDDLRAKGHAAFVEQAEVGGKTYFRVRIGPEVERARADALARRVTTATGPKPIVMSYP